VEEEAGDDGGWGREWTIWGEGKGGLEWGRGRGQEELGGVDCDGGGGGSWEGMGVERGVGRLRGIREEGGRKGEIWGWLPAKL